MTDHPNDAGFDLDAIGEWSELKLEIIKKYASAFSKILAGQSNMTYVYIDGFAGAGLHVKKGSGEVVAGTPLNVAAIVPPFKEIHLVELDTKKAEYLAATFKEIPRVAVHRADCNELLVSTLIPQVQFRAYKRGLCLLDPYGLDLEWKVVHAAGHQKTIDVLINFPVMDMNRNVLWRQPDKVSPDQIARMTRFWGDGSWQTATYGQEQTLYGSESIKLSNTEVVSAYCARLKSAGGFEQVAKPLPMRNSKNAVVYYLVFASQKRVAVKIMNDICKSRHQE